MSVRSVRAAVEAQMDPRVVAYTKDLRTWGVSKLLDELASCVRQNHSGSHDHQARLVRQEILRRTGGQ